ncbi:hypothetical protein CRUP_029749, partial [Coryphaenoides rupestris]
MGKPTKHIKRNKRGLFTERYTETHYGEDGNANNCYYHGAVRGHPTSDVSLSVCSGLRGFIALDNQTLVLEPAPGRNDTHFIYRLEDLDLTPGTCGHGFNVTSPAPGDGQGNPFRSFGTR